MENLLRKQVVLLACIIFSISAFAQSVTISGNVRDLTGNTAVASVSIGIKGTGAGTFTNDRGDFRLVTNQKPPFTLVISSIGYETQEVEVSDASAPIKIGLKSASILGNEVVVSASRVPERILESPVSIERIGSVGIRNSPAANYYDAIKTLKGVDVTTSSLTFNSVTTRGFNGSGNTRFNQFVDGMDNQAPGLNFSVGAVVGLTELDVDNMELLPGASSALYGSGGMNGTLLITSKDPFKYQGFSAQIKQGVMHLGKNDPIGTSPYYDWSFRWGQKIGDKFAFKIGAQFIQAQDWVASDSTNYTGAGTGSANHTLPGTRSSDPNYDGVNLYGDETSVNITSPSSPFLAGAAQQIVAANPAYGPAVAGILASDGANPFPVSRTGYKEHEVINNTTLSIKVSAGLYYKITPGIEASLTGNFGTGNTVYTGSDRYALKNLKIGQYKLEFKSAKWFLRAYTTQENSGDAYNATITTRLFNEAWKPSYNPADAAGSWYPQYAGGYLLARLNGADVTTANNLARAGADIGRPVPGSTQFKSLYDQVRSKPIPVGGGFLDRTNLYQAEGQYNLSSIVKFADVLVGASWREYVLNSQGTLFADSNGSIKTNEIGAYVQVSKKLLEDKLKLMGSIRYDKNDNFQGKFTPRFSAVYTVAQDQNIRASYQNAYRFPSNQNQWINLNTGAGILIGGLPSLRSFYHFDTNPVVNPNTGQLQTFGKYKPESVNSFELGYKGLFGKRFLIDVYGYYSKYKDFIGRTSVIQSTSGNPATIDPADPSSYQGFSVSVNSANTVNTYGGGIGIDYMMRKNFALSFNLSSDNIDNPDANFATYWNTPKYRFNIGLSNTGFGPDKRLGFNVQYRWQDKYFTEADFKQGNVGAFGTVDAQVSCKMPKVKTLIKIGATNILNKYYITEYANPAIGGLYYISLGYNVF
jgi:outer membrane receptor protein involved in Fe transport